MDVLVDLSSLHTPSRERGIGRYVRGLASGLVALRGSGDGAVTGLRLGGLVRHAGAVGGAVDESLTFDGDPAVLARKKPYGRHKLERRLFMGGLVRRTGARLLHLTDPYGTPFYGSTPRVVTCHDLIPYVLADTYLPRWPGARWVQGLRDRARYGSALRVIAVSEHTRRDLVRLHGVDAARIDVVHHGVDHQRFHARAAVGERARVAELFGTDAPYVLYMGAADPRKNVALLLEAFARARRAPELRLALVGPLDRARPALEAQAQSLGIRDRVLITGWVPEPLLAALYRQCELHVFPSSYEGFGLPVLEALACGAPTLTSTASSLAEVAGDAAEPLDTLAAAPLADALSRLLADDARRAVLRERGPAHAAAFTWERCARETAAVYRRALASLDQAG